MSESDSGEQNELRERLRRYYELLKHTTDVQAVRALWELISEAEERLRELGER